MKNLKNYATVSLIGSVLLSGIAVPASAATLSAAPQFTLTGSTAAITNSTGTWVGGTTTNQFYICTDSKTATSGEQTGSLPADCLALWTSSGLNTAFSGGELAEAWVTEGGMTRELFFMYGPKTHLVLVSKNVDGGTTKWSASASQLFVPDYTYSAMASVSISGNAVTFTPATWTNVARFNNYLVACTAAKPTAITVASELTFTTGCRPLYDPATVGQNQTPQPATSLTNATVFVVTNNTPSYVAYDSAVHGSYIAGFSFTWNKGLSTATIDISGGGTPAPEVIPYTGPLVIAPALTAPSVAGGKLVLSGSNLTGITDASIGGKSATPKLNAKGELELQIPAGLPAGKYDLVIISSSGKLTVQDAIVIAATAISNVKRAGNSVDVRVENGQRSQIILNGKRVASRSSSGVLTRTLNLREGLNVIQIVVAGKVIRTIRYTR